MTALDQLSCKQQPGLETRETCQLGCGQTQPSCQARSGFAITSYCFAMAAWSLDEAQRSRA